MSAKRFKLSKDQITPRRGWVDTHDVILEHVRP